ncbi:MAG: hypothetical protein IT443_06395 [Phycisphaeraceae bacterium]|nr:hypothetical protein [Phycisphaeraceae bacterium]
MPLDSPLVLNQEGIDRLVEMLRAAMSLPRPHRYIVGIAGIGGSGKSTLARQVYEALSSDSVALVPMDGFHLTNAQLERQGLRRQKGSPATFDARAYVHLLRQARDPGQQVPFPIYDRNLHEPIWPGDARHTINAQVKLVLTEGNYLLLNHSPWTELADVMDACWLLDTPLERARAWILARHVRGGRDPVDARKHYEAVDARNALLVAGQSRRPTLRLVWPD